VALEIRCTAFLRGLCVWTESGEDGAVLHVAGELAGVCDRPLDLYALLDGTTAIYASLETRADGLPFHLRSDPLKPASRPDGVEGEVRPHAVRVELVNGAVVWYAAEQPLLF
jgi:hypothetical protein